MKKHVSRLLQPGVIWYCVVLLVFTAAAAALDQYYLAGAELLVTAGVFLISRVRFARRKQELVDYVQSATDSVGVSVHAGSPFPMAVLHLPEAEIIWGNPAFYAITGLADATRYQTMDSVIPDFTTDWLRDGRNELPGDRKIGDRRYRIYGNYVRSSDDETTVMLATIYFADMTEMFNIRDEFVRTRPVVAVVLIDNYDELMNNLSDSAVANLNAQINETVSKWIGGAHALSRKIERNRYLLVFENSALEKLQNGKFSVLESIRTIVNPSGVAATISLGIGKDGASFEENYNYAMLSIEMALSRGGDQAVIKDRYNFTFYGGRTKETERHTKVKSRVVAGSLSELIAQSSEVFLMGHRMADLDAVGAAVGLLSLCRKKGKRGQMIEVSDGYARNFLFPKKLAQEANADNVNTMKMNDKARQEREAKERAEAMDISKRMKTFTVTVNAKGGGAGRLFGSVTNTEIAEALAAQQKIVLDKRKIVLDEPIKTTGVYTVRCKLGYEISGELRVEVKEA